MVARTPTDTRLPLRVAIIGYGHGGEVFHAPLIAATDGLEVGAIVTSDPARRARAGHAFPDARLYTAVEDLWADAARYHLVVITTPNRTHVPLGIAALEAGLSVVIDKPLAATVADAERVVTTSQRTGQMLSVFQNARWSNAFLTVRHLLSTGLVGPLTRFEARSERFRPLPRPGAWRERGESEEAGGLLYDLGSHLIDQALVLFGQPSHVYAEMERRRPGTQVDDDTFVALRFPTGVIAHLWMSYVARRPGAAIRLVGLGGTYEKRAVDAQEDALRAGHHPGEPGWGIEPRERWGILSTEIEGVRSEVSVETVPGAYQEYYAGVRDALTIGAAPPVHPEDAIATLRVIEAAQRSAMRGEVVRL